MYTKFLDYRIYKTEKKSLGNNITHIVSYEKESGKKVYDVYNVRYNTSYFTTDRVFDDYEKAYEYTRFCQIELNKQRFNNRKTDKYVAEVLEYPENLLVAIGIKPEDYANFYTEIIPNFDENFRNILDKGLLLPREQQVIVDRYQHYETLEQVGKSLGVTRERIRQIEYKALKKLQHAGGRNMLIQGREKFELINAEERARLLEEIKAAMTKDVVIEYAKNNLTHQELQDIFGVVYNREEEEKHNSILNEDIANLDLSVRSNNCLWRTGIKTIGDLVNKTEEEMMKVRNLGKRSLREIEIKLKKIGLCLRKEQ